MYDTTRAMLEDVDGGIGEASEVTERYTLPVEVAGSLSRRKVVTLKLKKTFDKFSRQLNGMQEGVSGHVALVDSDR